MSSEESATQIAPVETPQMVSTVKLPILKKGEYTLWSMRMEQYLTNTDYSLWQVILNGDGPIQVTTNEKGIETELRFHAIKDAKTLWAAIKSRFGGNIESKKMQKNVLKQQFENFSVSDTKCLDKAYDRFQKLISLLEVHVEGPILARECKKHSQKSREQEMEMQNFALMPILQTPQGLTQSSKDKTGLGYGDQLNENNSSGSELVNSVFDSRSSDGNENQTNDRFKKDNRYHVVPPPLTGNYIPPLVELSFVGLDDSIYRPTANKTSDSVSQVEANINPPSNTSVEMPRVESVRPSGVIIKDWVSDDEDIFQSNDLQATDKPSFKRIEFTNARNESVKPKQADKPRIITQNPKRMANKSVLKDLGKVTGHREVRPVWNNTQRINHQNKFVPSTVLARFGRVPVSAAKESSLRATTSITSNTSISNEKVNIVRVNGVNTAGQTIVSTVKGNEVTAVKASSGCVWRPKMTYLNNVSKDNSGSWVSKRVNYIDPQGRLKLVVA
ncbi:hypothetical protein Tco_0322836 [Tanacetum coccineum]